jgi:hypothetical protein
MAQMVMLAALAMTVGQTARLTFTSEDRVRDVLNNFNADGYDSRYPRKGTRTWAPIRHDSPRRFFTSFNTVVIRASPVSACTGDMVGISPS